MSQRVTTLCISVAMASLFANSTVAYATGLQPAIFAGPAYFVLTAMMVICVAVWAMAERDHRRLMGEREEDLRIAIMVTEWKMAEARRGRRS